MPNFCCFIFSDSLTAAQSHATKMPIFSIFFSFQKYEVEVDVIKLVSEKIRDEREVVRSFVRSSSNHIFNKEDFFGKNIFFVCANNGIKRDLFLLIYFSSKLREKSFVGT